MNELAKTTTDATSVKEAAELGRQIAAKNLGLQKGAYLDAAPFVIVRGAGGVETVQIIHEVHAPPHRKTGAVKLNDAESFIAYYALHGNGAPVYATLQPAQFVGVLNDHTKNEAGYRDHRSVFKVAHSPEWESWTKHNGSGAAFNSNESFALFLEENALDIVKPDAAQMLQIALNFRVNADVRFSTSQRLQDGNVELAFANVVNASAGSAAGGKIKITETFTIEIPVFAGLNAKRYKVEARFRYRLRDGSLSLWYELIHSRKAMEQAFKDIWAQIEKATKAAILHGTPE